MSVLDQCMSVINLTSLDWSEEKRPKNEERCHRWFLSWMDTDKYLNEREELDEGMDYASEDIPF